ncbi:hypothetical protein HMI54_013067 [Coelomomyces lativittatus]|nr:hypothetical protein HMI56_004027 [Coelomomyces lativittatus]KAJ1505761.1 hypothetical protein HMI55_001461 [Coelomomyces lativittatus]KAJ1514963.1 hypothetical protein HMI54_013067 [Coelomomyces lativittatus]
MKLQADLLRHLTSEDFRVLTSVEMGSKNHEYVPIGMISQLSRQKEGCVRKNLLSLSKLRLVFKGKSTKYEGYRLAFGGYDYLALHTFSCRQTMIGIGPKFGVGKESDIYEAVNEQGNRLALKIHRLGRISFRAVKTKRDYIRPQSSTSWLYLSRIAATKEYNYMKALKSKGFPVPAPIDGNRHCVLMELIEGVPLCQVNQVADVGQLYHDLMYWISMLAKHGLVHGDFNEFNLLIDEETQKPWIIDFPQMISTLHPNAQETFERDVKSIKDFFKRKFHFIPETWPLWEDHKERIMDLDSLISVSGAVKLSKRQLQDLETYLSSIEPSSLTSEAIFDESDFDNSYHNATDEESSLNDDSEIENEAK